MKYKKALSYRLGAFFMCLFFPFFCHASAKCPPKGGLQWHSLARIVDGDTLRLSDGSKVRVLAINTPELNNKGGAAEPMAVQARQAVAQFFANDSRVGIQPGALDRDRYGRLLAHVYREDGLGLAEYLLARGLAQQVVIPPNTAYWQCLAGIEMKARSQRQGLWAETYFAPVDADALSAQHAGFRRVRGRVSSVVKQQGRWWLEMGRLAVTIHPGDNYYFGKIDVLVLLHKDVEVVGWVVDRSDRNSLIKKGFKPFLMKLTHPAMIDF